MAVLSELEKLSRQDLIERALRYGVPRPELMTRVELTDEIVRRSETDPGERKRARGWLGIARDLLASVVEQGLHLPEAAALIRGDVSLELGARAPAPVATVTLSEIYAAQGHLDRAVKMLDQVLDKEPDHEPARALRDKFVAERDRRAAMKAAARSRDAAVEESQPDEAREGTLPESGLTNTVELEAAEASAEVKAEAEAEAGAVASAEVGAEPPAVAPTGPRELEAGAERDCVVVMRSEGGRIRVYWELRPESRRRAEQRWPNGRAVVRVVGWRPSWDGAVRFEHDVEIEKEQDSATVDSLGEVAAVRAALGWNTAGELHPFSLATELSAGASATNLQLKWEPPGRTGLGENASVLAARAFEHWGGGGPG